MAWLELEIIIIICRSMSSYLRLHGQHVRRAEHQDRGHYQHPPQAGGRVVGGGVRQHHGHLPSHLRGEHLMLDCQVNQLTRILPEEISSNTCRPLGVSVEQHGNFSLLETDTNNYLVILTVVLLICNFTPPHLTLG